MTSLSDGDRSAFHNQVDRVLDALDTDPTEMNRIDKDLAVKAVFANFDSDAEFPPMAELLILPRHRFLVKATIGDEREVFYRRDEAVDLLDDILS